MPVGNVTVALLHYIVNAYLLGEQNVCPSGQITGRKNGFVMSWSGFYLFGDILHLGDIMYESDVKSC